MKNQMKLVMKRVLLGVMLVAMFAVVNKTDYEKIDHGNNLKKQYGDGELIIEPVPMDDIVISVKID